METLFLALRVLLSLAVVLGLLWLAQRKLTRSGRASRSANLVTVVARQGISPKASVVIVDSEGKRFILGITEQSVNVLHTGDIPADGSCSDVFTRSMQEALAAPVDLVTPESPMLTSVPTYGTGTDGAAVPPTRAARRAGHAGSAALPMEYDGGAAYDDGSAHDGVRYDGSAGYASGSGTGAMTGRSGRRAARPVSSAAAPASKSAASGSILSADTWKQTVAAIRQGRNG